MTDSRVSPGPGAYADRRAVRTAALLLTALTAGAYLPSPLYPDYQRLFGYDDLVMTLLFATFALVSGPALLLCGPAADAVGPRPVLRLSLLPAAAGSGCFAVADSPAWLFAGRVCQALALGAATGAAQALMSRHRSPTSRVGAPLLASLAFAGGTAVGPAASGLLVAYVPWPLLTPYLLHLALLAWVWHRLRRTVPAAASADPAPLRGRTVRARRPARTGTAIRTGISVRPRIPAALRATFAVAGLSGFFAWAVVGLQLALVPALLARTPHGGGPALTGGVLAAVLVWSVLTQFAAARCSALAAQLLGVAALSGSLSLLAATGATSLTGTLGSALLAGTGHGLAVGGAARAVDARTPAGQRSGIAAALYLLFYLGSGVPAVAVGLLSLRMPLTVAVTGL
ncbi:MFS transporter, partial [Streptomyces nanshensis]